MIDQGRVELASGDCLKQAQVAKLIDPYLYRPVYCRKENISGVESLQSKAERLSMGAPHGGAVAAVLDAGDDWVFVYTNVRFDRTDMNDFKFLERLPTIENNGIFACNELECGMEVEIALNRRRARAIDVVRNHPISTLSPYFPPVASRGVMIG